LINLALAEEIAVLDAAPLEARKQAGSGKPALDILRKAGKEPPRAGDELPDEIRGRKFRHRKQAAAEQAR